MGVAPAEGTVMFLGVELVLFCKVKRSMMLEGSWKALLEIILRKQTNKKNYLIHPHGK